MARTKLMRHAKVDQISFAYKKNIISYFQFSYGRSQSGKVRLSIKQSSFRVRKIFSPQYTDLYQFLIRQNLIVDELFNEQKKEEKQNIDEVQIEYPSIILNFEILSFSRNIKHLQLSDVIFSIGSLESILKSQALSQLEILDVKYYLTYEKILKDQPVETFSEDFFEKISCQNLQILRLINMQFIERYLCKLLNSPITENLIELKLSGSWIDDNQDENAPQQLRFNKFQKLQSLQMEFYQLFNNANFKDTFMNLILFKCLDQQTIDQLLLKDFVFNKLEDKFSFCQLRELKLLYSFGFKLEMSSFQLDIGDFENLEYLEIIQHNSINVLKLSKGTGASQLTSIKLQIQLLDYEEFIDLITNPYLQNLEHAQFQIAFSDNNFNKTHFKTQNNLPQLESLQIDIDLSSLDLIAHQILSKQDFFLNITQSKFLKQLQVLNSTNGNLHTINQLINLQILSIKMRDVFNFLELDVSKLALLKNLDFSNSDISDQDLVKILNNIKSPSLKSLCLIECLKFIGECFSQVENNYLEGIEYLDVSQSSFQFKYLRNIFLSTFGRNLKVFQANECDQFDLESPCFNYVYGHEMGLQIFQTECSYDYEPIIQGATYLFKDILKSKEFVNIRKLKFNATIELDDDIIGGVLDIFQNMGQIQTLFVNFREDSFIDHPRRRIIEFFFHLINQKSLQTKFMIYKIKKQRERFVQLLKLFRIEIFYEIISDFFLHFEMSSS